MYGSENTGDRVASCCFGCLESRGDEDGHFACRWREDVQRAWDEGRLRDNRFDGDAWTARIRERLETTVARSREFEFHPGHPEVQAGDHGVMVCHVDAWRSGGDYASKTPLVAMVRVGAERCDDVRGTLMRAAHEARVACQIGRMEYITIRAKLGRRARSLLVAST